LDVQVFNQKVKIKADQVYASKNIVIYSGDRLIFAGSLSRNAEMSLSLSSKDGRKVAKEFNKNMEIYGKLN